VLDPRAQFERGGHPVEPTEATIHCQCCSRRGCPTDQGHNRGDDHRADQKRDRYWLSPGNDDKAGYANQNRRQDGGYSKESRSPTKDACQQKSSAGLDDKVTHRAGECRTLTDVKPGHCFSAW
jgi:hypothetical protein